MVIKLVHPVYKFTMVAGRSKRKKSFFKKGNGFGVKPSSMPYVDVQDKPVVRLDENEFRNIVHTTPKKEMVTFGTGGERVPSTLLRASKVSDNFYSDYDENDSIPEGEDTTYMVVHRGNTLKLFNQAFQDHQNESPECSGALQWDQARWRVWWRLLTDPCEGESRPAISVGSPQWGDGVVSWCRKRPAYPLRAHKEPDIAHQ